ncbi:HlyD family efflux transporter periplasmic adaptor subunit [Pseudomarimonas arenosa]|uniref:HlyD family efflux transporter periplasmic adaptor subunit n=1 Tax=Pseudomarimonas arenosa TaxID=2774145 RepID=A0AAW3ZR70_9GAMM|nr:HlyD family efflux transporter periplasmic adaptor subunit [Pseudomarimonas arenosa]MBD8528035.1 HlyD family efflux transporter periplasmic adaptor subunit [Pseudomarimonas arenosa]
MPIQESAAETAVDQLFRQEAVAAASSRFGSPVKPVGVAGWLLSLLLLLTLIVAGVFLATASYPRKEIVVGSIQYGSGAPRIVSPRPGTVAEILVREGQEVVAGQPLMAIALDPVLDSGERQGEAIESAVIQQAEARIRDLDAQIESNLLQERSLLATSRSHQEQLVQLNEQLQLQVARVLLAERTLVDVEPLVSKGHIPAIQVRTYEAELLAAKQSRVALQRELSTTHRLQSEAEASVKVLRSERTSLRARLEVEQGTLAEKQASLSGSSRLLLTAPIAGRATSIVARLGMPVEPASALAIIVPSDQRLQAELWVPSRAVGFLQSGQEVRYMYDAFPIERFGLGTGSIVSVSQAAVLAPDLVKELQTDEPMYRVIASIQDQAIGAYGDEWPLSSGMRLQAALVLERRSLLQWLIDPLRAASKKNQL